MRADLWADLLTEDAVRARLAQATPALRALSREEQRLLLRAAERAEPRNRALVVVLLFAELRISEAVALDLDDVWVSSRKGTVIVRSGKRDAYREVPLNAPVRATITEWLERRPALADGKGKALFVSRGGRQLSARRRTRRCRGWRATPALRCRRTRCGTRV